MVALFSPSPASDTFLPLLRRSFVMRGIKILDLLTNRYHAGVVHAALADGLQIEVPLSAHLSAGQRVHFALDEAAGIVPRQTMRSAMVRRVQATQESRLRIELSTAECLAA